MSIIVNNISYVVNAPKFSISSQLRVCRVWCVLSFPADWPGLPEAAPHPVQLGGHALGPHDAGQHVPAVLADAVQHSVRDAGPRPGQPPRCQTGHQAPVRAAGPRHPLRPARARAPLTAAEGLAAVPSEGWDL